MREFSPLGPVILFRGCCGDLFRCLVQANMVLVKTIISMAIWAIIWFLTTGTGSKTYIYKLMQNPILHTLWNLKFTLVFAKNVLEVYCNILSYRTCPCPCNLEIIGTFKKGSPLSLIKWLYNKLNFFIFLKKYPSYMRIIHI